MYRRDALPSERHEAARHARIVAVRCIRRAVSIDDLTLRHLRGSAIMFWHQCQEMLAEIGFPAAVAGWICTHQCLVCLRHYDWPPRRVLTACGAELRADIRSVLWLKDHMHGGSTAGERGNLYCCNRKQLIATSAPEVEKS